jgi:hypothetical protein
MFTYLRILIRSIRTKEVKIDRFYLTQTKAQALGMTVTDVIKMYVKNGYTFVGVQEHFPEPIYILERIETNLN